MKSIKFVSAIAMAAGILAMGSAQAAPDGGTLRFYGLVKDTTCTITGGSGTANGEDDISVTLAPVETTELAKADDKAGFKLFSLVIGGAGQGSCENGKIADLRFNTSSGRIDAGTGRLTNAAANGAKNTNIQLTDSAGNAYNLADPTLVVSSAAIANNTATITMGAQYYATGAATAGPVDTNVQYLVTYR